MTAGQSLSSPTATSETSNDQESTRGTFRPLIAPPPPTHRGREDVVALMKRDMSYTAVAAAGIQSGSDSDDDIDVESEASTMTDNDKMDGSTLSRRVQRQSESTNAGKDDSTEEDPLQGDIDSLRKLVLLLLCVVGGLLIVAVAAVSASIQKERGRLDEFSSPDDVSGVGH
jgi:hypothetical protein